MMQPTMVDIIARIKTPAALISLITFISGLISLLIKSHKCSIAVLKTSAPITTPTQSNIPIHSMVLSFKIRPKQNTNIEIKTCILKLISDNQTTYNPSYAYLNPGILYF